MKISKDKPYVLHVAELIYLKVVQIKKENPGITNIDAVDRFIGSDLYKEISSGEFHDKNEARLSHSMYNLKMNHYRLILLHVIP